MNGVADFPNALFYTSRLYPHCSEHERCSNNEGNHSTLRAAPFAAAFISVFLVVGLAIVRAHRYVGFVRGGTLPVSEGTEVDLES